MLLGPAIRVAVDDLDMSKYLDTSHLVLIDPASIALTILSYYYRVLLGLLPLINICLVI